MRNKQTLIISSYDDKNNPYYGGGGAIAITEVAKRLTQQFNVIVITGKYPNSKNETIDGVQYERVGIARFGGKIGQLVFQLALPPLVMSKKYDIWMESFTPPFSTSCLQLYTKKPVVGLVHMLSGEDMRRKYKLPFDVFEKVGLQTYTHIIVLSEDVKKKIKKINSKATIRVIPNGIDNPIGSFKRKAGKYILFLGRIEVNQKGLDLLIKAYESVAKEVDLPLIIAGSGEKSELAKLKKLHETSRFSQNIKLVGRVNGSKKISLFQDAACLVVPSRFETFSLVALEAMSYGVPVVSFAIDGVAWIPSEIVKKATPFNTDILGKYITGVVKNKEISDTMIKSGKEFVKKFSWESVAKSYADFLSKLN